MIESFSGRVAKFEICNTSNFKLVKSLVMFRIMHINPVGCG